MKYIFTIVLFLCVVTGASTQIPTSNPVTPILVNQTDTLNPGYYLLDAEAGAFEIVLRDKFGSWIFADPGQSLGTNTVTIKVPDGKSITGDNGGQVPDGTKALNIPESVNGIVRPKASDDYYFIKY